MTKQTKANDAKAAKAAAPKAAKGAAPKPLVWDQHGKDTWLAPDPDGDASVAGGRIKMSTQRWVKGADADPVYYVYRDGDYLGTDPTLKAAQRRAQYREKSARALADTTDGGLPAFLAVSPEERRKERAKHPLAPSVRKSWGNVGDMARAQVEAGRSNVEKPSESAAALRAAIKGERVATKEAAKAAKRATKDAAKYADADVIHGVVANPRKPGSGAHARFEVLRAHEGKTMAQYRAANGNMETLENAVTAARAKVRKAGGSDE